MEKTLQKFINCGIDLTSVGFRRREDAAPYFCTPRGANIIGWAGVDGIHFCFIRGFGSMVFAVSPMNSMPDYVHPIARDFCDFLCLLLACGDTAALEQAWEWNQAQFDAYLQENKPTQEQREILSDAAAKMKLSAMEQPWAYLHTLQAAFDYSQIRYTENFYDRDMNPSAPLPAAEWRVYYEGNFWGHHGRDHAGKPISVEKQFRWAEHEWMVPAVYVCSRGIVVDLCKRVEAEEISAFMRRWNLNGEENLTQEQRRIIEAENPMNADFTVELELNGQMLRAAHGCSACYNPCLPAENDLQAEGVVAHYSLDASCAWVLARYAFPWPTKRRPDIKSLRMMLSQQAERVVSAHFKPHKPGESITFAHPVSGREYTLTVQKLEQQSLPERSFDATRWFYPTHYTAMQYTISPSLDETILVCDCDEGDRPLRIAPEQGTGPTADADAAVIGIIGGADGPTALLFGGGSGEVKIACSALHFEPTQDDVEWCVMFNVRRYDDAAFSLL